MTMQTAEITAPAVAPLGEFRFEIGACVTHVSQDIPSIVTGRTRTSDGLEVYALHSYADGDLNRDRLILADSLRPIDGVG